MLNSEIAKQIFDRVESRHANIYHDVSKKEFYDKLNKFLQVADKLDDLHFDAEMSKLFALFKDAHTMYVIEDMYVKNCVKCIGNQFYYFDQGICEKIIKVNGFDIDFVVNKLSQLEQTETKAWLNYLLTRRLRGIKYLQMVDCNNENPKQIEYLLSNGQVVVENPVNNDNAEPYYSYTYKDKILFVNYKLCKNMADYPFSQFVLDIKKDCKVLPKACVIDMRNNEGGNSDVIKPLFDWFKEINMNKIFVLVNGGIFSSACIVLAKLINKFHAVTIGTDAGQSQYFRYGGCVWEKIAGKEFSYCTELCGGYDPTQNYDVDFYDPIHPTIYLEEDPNCVKLGIDNQMAETIKLVNNELNKK